MIWHESLISTAVGAVGAILVSQSISFAWERAGLNPEIVSHDQSVCLFCAGVALLGLAAFVRQTTAKLSALEKEISDLRWSRDQARLDKVLPSVS